MDPSDSNAAAAAAAAFAAQRGGGRGGRGRVVEDVDEDEAKDEVKKLPVMQTLLPPGMNRRRRVSVSAEADRDQSYDKFVRKVVPKSEEARERIKKAVQNSFLFTGLESEQKQAIFDAMEEVKVDLNTEIIKQGAEGDYFYVVESGKYDVYRRDLSNPDLAAEKKVFHYDETGSFGELALMYNAPRAASVRARTPGILWAVDRATFRHIIIEMQAKKRSTYETWLHQVPLFRDLTKHELSLIADALESQTFEDGSYIIKQGDIGDHFYIIVQGECVATQKAPGQTHAVEVGRMKVGDYFGERALLTNNPRAANVIAVGQVKVAAMDRAAFERLLGDCRERMQDQITLYKLAEEILHKKLAEATSVPAPTSSSDLAQTPTPTTVATPTNQSEPSQVTEAR